MFQVKIIGAGQLGSRHLQALKSVKYPLSIEVVDPSQESLRIAKERYDSIESIGTQHSIVYSTEYLAKDSVDIVIVASTAKSRCGIIETIFKYSEPRYIILEKILFEKKADYMAVSELLSQKNTKVWVNCCMRMMPFYRDIQSLFLGTKIHYAVYGSTYGLASNAIHYLDHAVYLSGCKDFKVDTTYLESQVVSSKRAGYLEVTGNLLAQFSDGSFVNLQCLSSGNSPIQIEISNEDVRVISCEWQQKALIAKRENDWMWEECEATIPYQSQLTAVLVQQLIETGNCILTDFTESVHTHLQLLEPLKTFLQKQNVKIDVDYPFT